MPFSKRAQILTKVFRAGEDLLPSPPLVARLETGERGERKERDRENTHFK